MLNIIIQYVSQKEKKKKEEKESWSPLFPLTFNPPIKMIDLPKRLSTSITMDTPSRLFSFTIKSFRPNKPNKGVRKARYFLINSIVNDLIHTSNDIPWLVYFNRSKPRTPPPPPPAVVVSILEEKRSGYQSNVFAISHRQEALWRYFNTLLRDPLEARQDPLFYSETGWRR